MPSYYLIPALLVITGRWVFWPARPGYGSAEPTTKGLWARIGNRIAVRPRTVWIATVVVLALICVAPGIAWLTAVGGRAEPGLIFAFSLGLAAVVATLNHRFVRMPRAVALATGAVV